MLLYEVPLAHLILYHPLVTDQDIPPSERQPRTGIPSSGDDGSVGKDVAGSENQHTFLPPSILPILQLTDSAPQ